MKQDLKEPIVDTCSPILAKYLIEKAGKVPKWFSDLWEKIINKK